MTDGNDKHRALKQAEAASFGRVAPSFGSLSERITGPLADAFVEWAEIGAGDRVLDVGTGTGIVARRAAKIAGATNVVGIDLSPAMLREARSERTEEARPLRLAAADAERLSFAAGSFDRTLSLFAVSHVPDRAAVAGEMFRVLRRGGTVAVGVGSGPSRWSLAAVRHAFRVVPERFARATGRRLDGPGTLVSLVPEGSRRSRSPAARTTGAPVSDWLPRLLRDAGFRDLATAWVRQVATFADVGAFWETHTTFSTPSRDWLAAAPDSEIADVRAAFERACRRVLDRGGTLAYPFGALLVGGRRP